MFEISLKHIKQFYSYISGKNLICKLFSYFMRIQKKKKSAEVRSMHKFSEGAR